jgi:CRP/FNR family cyclic AMP-dependent transcriptional regulator
MAGSDLFTWLPHNRQKITGGRVKDRSAEILPAPLLEQVAAGATVRSFSKRSIMVTEGDDTDSLYVILSGKARVFVADDKGHEVQLNQIGPGEYFGEITLDGGPRSASVMALEDCRCAIVKRAEFDAFLQGHPELALHIVRKLAGRVRALTDNVRSLALMDVYGRVARLLLELAEEKDGKLVVAEALTHKDIASRVGASREMISRIFSDLAEGGYVRKEDGRLVIARKPPPRW